MKFDKASLEKRQRAVMNHLEYLLHQEGFVRELDDAAELYANENPTEGRKIIEGLAIKYGLSPEDIASVLTDRELPLNPIKHSISGSFRVEQRTHPKNIEKLGHTVKHSMKVKALTNPVSLHLTPHTTKTEFKNFIEKHWYSEIEPYLKAADAPPIKNRQKLDDERDELIWQNQDKPAKQILAILKENNVSGIFRWTSANVSKCLYRLRKRYKDSH